MTLDPHEAALRGRIGAFVKASRYSPEELTGPARRGFMARFYRDLPAGLSQEEADRRAAALLKAHMHRLAMKSARARKASRISISGSNEGRN